MEEAGEAKEDMEEAGRGRKCEGWLEKMHLEDQSGVLVYIRLLLG